MINDSELSLYGQDQRSDIALDNMLLVRGKRNFLLSDHLWTWSEVGMNSGSTKHVGGFSWMQVHELLGQSNYSMPTIRQYFTAMDELHKNRCYNGLGKRMSRADKNRMYSNMNSSFSEWLDAYFTDLGTGMCMQSGNTINDGHRTTKISHICYPMDSGGIELASINAQGLPTQRGNVQYVRPKNSTVARWTSDSALRLDISPHRRYMHTGVRPMRWVE